MFALSGTGYSQCIWLPAWSTTLCQQSRAHLWLRWLPDVTDINSNWSTPNPAQQHVEGEERRRKTRGRGMTCLFLSFMFCIDWRGFVDQSWFLTLELLCVEIRADIKQVIHTLYYNQYVFNMNQSLHVENVNYSIYFSSVFLYTFLRSSVLTLTVDMWSHWTVLKHILFSKVQFPAWRSHVDSSLIS